MVVRRPYDCCIDLLAGATLPSSRLYSLSAPEKASMEAYIHDSLASARFSTAPILCHPDPSQFVVEVDASDTGVGAVLSQCSALDQKTHPCAFFSCRLTPAQCNYDVGDHSVPGKHQA
ncbi:hypothetical protein SKAU_G00263720 [Synaphobranchus kaupii]|uniref:Reverse transcriptase/retrotransposon-derived protein RNase H-like domain-containing protein n=1 Tax=Synaphobranchus kaupii TaxID=118154 RepID=A0A9Q1EYX9_SYNKA|nr:hypothetical protein SKAU_G00263720 [Synaphobranchus kaupii]